MSDVSVSDKYADIFDSSNISYDENMEYVCFSALKEYSESDSALFDNVSMEEATTEIQEDNVKYECSFDMNNLAYHFTATLLDDEGNAVATEELHTDAIVTENGGLDACIEIDGNSYMLSDYEDVESIDNCAIISIKNLIKIVTAYLAVSEAAEQIKCRSNYTYNKELEAAGNGVNKRTYITAQDDITTVGHRPGNYKFGFASFANTGCGVAAIYNTMIALGSPEMLSETIYCVEAWCIEFSIGWGHLGADPLEIYRYLNKKGINYKMYTSYSALESAVAGKKRCFVIMSRWNSDITTGAHTFYVKKTGSSSFYSYNWRYSSKSVFDKSLATFNDGSGFIVGYLIWK